MNYDGVNSIVCDAEENDWLDVSYSERKYVEQPAAKQRKFKFGLPKIKINKKFALSIGGNGNFYSLYLSNYFLFSYPGCTYH